MSGMPIPSASIVPSMHARCPPDADALAWRNLRRRVGDDKDSIHVTFRPDDGSNDPKATPSPGNPSKAQGGVAPGSPADVAKGFPLPVEEGSGQDFWGGQRKTAPAAEDAVQIPIEGIPDKVRSWCRGPITELGCASRAHPAGPIRH